MAETAEQKARRLRAEAEIAFYERRAGPKRGEYEIGKGTSGNGTSAKPQKKRGLFDAITNALSRK